MMKKISVFVCAMIVLACHSQAATVKSPKALRIVYQTYYNGKPRDNGGHTIMEIASGIAKITRSYPKQDKNVPQQTTYLDYNEGLETKTAVLSDGSSFYTQRAFAIGDKLELLPDTEVIAGYTCRKAKKIVNSNTLEIWYTTAWSNMRGSMQPMAAIPDGVVLKVVRNGQMAEVAEKVELLSSATDLKPQPKGEQMTARAYNYRIQQSQVIAVDVFANQPIYFRDIPKVTELSDTKVMQFVNGTIVLRKVQLPTDNRGYSIFAEVAQHSAGDAYDRTGCVFVIPTDRKKSFIDGLLGGVEALPVYTDKHGEQYQGIVASSEYLPPVELMRFYTSFGVKGYNHIEVANYNWPDSVVYKQEITDYASLLKGEAWIGAWIGNYAKDGHELSLKIKYYPKDKEDNDNSDKAVYPLFTTTNIMEMGGQAYPEGLFRGDSLTVSFTTDKPLRDAYIRYISTGHGGWGAGDEFTPKLNELFLDGTRLMGYTPWREDCGSYRGLNPASGNFSNGLSSSDLSRSGWCPGMVSYPVMIHVGDLPAGSHTLRLAIPVGNPEGSSRSYWCTSGVLIGGR